MWVVYRDQKNERRMYWTGGFNNDWSGNATRAACWQDRREANHVATKLVTLRPGPVYGEVFVQMPVADPGQYIPGADQGR